MYYPRIGRATLLLGALTSLVYFSGCGFHKGSVTMTNRSSHYPILDVILHRWSPYAMSGELLSQEELMTVLEAGRWAPSSYNNQPWHFIYGVKGTSAWDTLFNLLVPFNQSWSIHGGVLVCIVADKDFRKTGNPSRTHLSDAGSAWENMAIQATAMGLVCHGMEGFNYAQGYTTLQIPETHEIVMIFVLGKPGSADLLPPHLAERQTPSDRVPLEQIISEGVFKNIRSKNS